jgi:hypothetical protein
VVDETADRALVGHKHRSKCAARSTKLATAAAACAD